MKKLSIILLAIFGLAVAFSSCKKEDKIEKKGIVQINKKHEKALLLVTFGSTWDDPHHTYDKMVAAYKAEFPNRDIYLSFTSTICISRWGAKTNEYFATPDIWLNALADHKYKEIAVQSLHVIPGEEYLLVRDKYVKEFKDTHANIPVVVGDALLTSQQDIQEVGDVLINTFKAKLDNGEALVLMGHGNPKDEFNGDNNVNASYENIQAYMHANYGNSIFVGTVDYEPMLIDKVLENMSTNIANGSVVNLFPLMSIAGDHANNDMAGDEDPEVGADEQSWKIQMRAAGYQVANENCILKGLGDYPEVVDVWIRHTHEALENK